MFLYWIVHAARHGRKYLAVWLAAFLAGTANDAIFMMLPMVDNFWQAQVRLVFSGLEQEVVELHRQS